jgi:hypothetical protein
MASQGPSFATAWNTESTWTNPERIATTDSSYASWTFDAGNFSNYLIPKTFDLSIPSGATIDGIEVKFVNRYASVGTQIYDGNIYLTKNGNNGVGSDHRLTGTPEETYWNTSPTTHTFGGASDLWGTTWTPAEINASTFGVLVQAWKTSGSGQIAYVDSVTITVYYTSAPGYGHKILGCLPTAIAKVLGVSTANIAKVNGV